MELYVLSPLIPPPFNFQYVTRASDSAQIPFAPGNTDYANFKSQINADEAQLEDADGVLMSPEEAKAFVATLP